MSDHLILVLAADPEDWINWCHTNRRDPLDGNAWAITAGTGALYGHHRTMQVTPRWRERKRNRRLVAELHQRGIPYGDENGPWPPERIPDLGWPSLWQRLTGGKP